MTDQILIFNHTMIGNSYFFVLFFFAFSILTGCSLNKPIIHNTNLQICIENHFVDHADRNTILLLIKKIQIEGDKQFHNQQYENALNCYQKGFDIQLQKFGSEDKYLLKSFYNIATIHEVKEDYDQAEYLYIKALNLIKRPNQSKHNHLNQYLGYLAAIRHQKMSHLTEQSLTGILIAFKQLKDSANIRVGAVQHKRAQIYLNSKLYKKSEQAFKSALSIVQNQIGNQHPYYAKIQQDYAELLLLTGRKNQSTILVNQSNLILDKYPKKQHTKLYQKRSFLNML